MCQVKTFTQFVGMFLAGKESFSVHRRWKPWKFPPQWDTEIIVPCYRAKGDYRYMSVIEL